MPLLCCKRRMSVRKLYPQGKAKAFQLTYDDGVLQDVPLVQLLNRYGIKATFNLNSQLMAEGFAWTHPNGMQVVRLSPEAVQGLYDGHEIASHTLTHPYMQDLSREELLRQMGQDRESCRSCLAGKCWALQCLSITMTSRSPIAPGNWALPMPAPAI